MAELFEYLADRTRLTHHFYAVFNCICRRPEATSDVISGRTAGQVGVDEPVKLGDSISNGSRNIRQRIRRRRNFDRFSNVDNFRSKVGSEGISGVFIEPSSMKAFVKFGTSMSNRSQVIRRPHFVTNDDDDGVRWPL